MDLVANQLMLALKSYCTVSSLLPEISQINTYLWEKQIAETPSKNSNPNSYYRHLKFMQIRFLSPAHFLFSTVFLSLFNYDTSYYTIIWCKIFDFFFINWCNLSHIFQEKKSIKYVWNVHLFQILIIWITKMTSFESLHIFKLIKI